MLAVARCVRLRRIDGLTVAYALSGPIGLGVVAATQAAQVDDPAAFAKGQEGWDRALSAPWVPIYRATDGIIDKLPRPAMELGLNLAAILLVGAALVVVTARLRGGTSAWGFIGWGWVAWFTPYGRLSRRATSGSRSRRGQPLLSLVTTILAGLGGPGVPRQPPRW